MTVTDVKALGEALTNSVGQGNVLRETAGYSIDGAVPSFVVLPKSIESLRSAMAVASELGAATAPWGGGTRMALGNTIRRLDLVTDLSGLDRVVQHTPGDLTVTVEAGVTLARLQATLREHSQFLSLDPPLPQRATVGGTLATAVSGPAKWQYMSPRDAVIGMKVVNADGTVTKSGGQVVKNVSGYDMSRLHVGGLGTLGIIAEASFKLTPTPKQEATLLASYPSTSDCLKASLEIFGSHIVPLGLATLDSAVNERAGAASVDDARLLAVRLAGRPMTLDRQLRDSTAICRDAGAAAVERLDDDAAASLWRRVSDFGWDERTAPTIGCRASLVPSALPEVVADLEQIGTSLGLTPAIVCHPAHGTVLAHWFAQDNGVGTGGLAAMLSAVGDTVRAAAGHMVIERCPAEVKAGLDVFGDIGDSLPIMKNLKEQYDHGNILNPGRYAGRI